MMCKLTLELDRPRAFRLRLATFGQHQEADHGQVQPMLDPQFSAKWTTVFESLQRLLYLELTRAGDSQSPDHSTGSPAELSAVPSCGRTQPHCAAQFFSKEGSA